MEQQGYIYLITNDVDDKKYVGQTSRDIDVRFDEHIYDESNSAIHAAIVKYGRQHFSIKEIEKVPLSQLDEREIYWIAYYDAYKNGYNKTPRGGYGVGNNYNNLYIVEKNFYVPSIEYFARKCKEVVNWSKDTIGNNIKKVVNTDKTFLNYHFKTAKANLDEYVDEDVLIDWIKTLKKVNYQKAVYCKKFDRVFLSIGEATSYCINNGYYKSNSNCPSQALRTAIARFLKGDADTIIGLDSDITFENCYVNPDEYILNYNWEAKKIYCPQLDMVFNSISEAGRYFQEKKLFGSVKFKTAKCRISDVCNKYFQEYKGYTFNFIENEKNNQNITEEKISDEQFIQILKECHSYEEATQRLKMSNTTIKRKCKELKTDCFHFDYFQKKYKEKFKYHFSDEDIQEIIKLYTSGFSMKKIGEKYNCFSIIISRILKLHGIKARSGTQHLEKPIFQLDKDTLKILKQYPSISDAKQDEFFSDGISDVINRHIKSGNYKGYKWILCSSVPDLTIRDIVPEDKLPKYIRKTKTNKEGG